MIAEQIVSGIRAAGATITAAHDQLRVVPADVLTAGHKAALTNHKADVLDFLAHHDDTLLGALVTATAGLPVDAAEAKAALSQADVDDWHAGEIGAETLRAFALALDDGRERKAGRIPESYLFDAVCTHCGPVWLFTAGHVDGCPWCVNRANGWPIPRPDPVTCADCRHFQYTGHPHLGHCAAGVAADNPTSRFWDTDQRGCLYWLPIDTTKEQHHDR